MSLQRASRDCPDKANESAEASPSGFRVPGLSSAEDSSGSSDDASSHSSGNTPWRRRRKRHRPTGYTRLSEISATAAMETEHNSEALHRAPNRVWASVLADSVLDDAMSAHMRVYRSDRSVEAYAYPGMSARRRVERSREEGELAEDDEVEEEGEVEEKDDEEEEEEEEGREDSHSDSLSIDNNVDPGEFAREGPRGRFDMEDVEAMDTNSRSALPCASTTAIGPAGDAEPQPGTSRKRPRRKKRISARARLGKRSFDPDKARPAFDLNADRSDEEIAAAMALRLRESRSDLLLRCLRLLGREKSYHLMLLTEDIEDAGGLYTADGSRRRTTGGVFFHILREDDEITADKKRQIFAPSEEELEYRKEKKRRKRINAGRRLQQRHGSGSRPPLDEWAATAPPFPPVGGLPGLPGLTPPHASTTSSSPPSSTLASAEAASSGKTPNNSPRPAPLEVDDF